MDNVPTRRFNLSHRHDRTPSNGRYKLIQNSLTSYIVDSAASRANKQGYARATNNHKHD